MIERELARRTLLLGGATGTELLAARGPHQVESAWLEPLNRTHPDLVRDVHARFLAAGCDAVATNSFRALCDAPPPEGLGAEAPALARRAAELAREACDDVAARFALGSLGPGPSADAAPRALEASYRAAAMALVAGGVDALLFETVWHPQHLAAALAAASTCKVPVIVSFTVEPDGATRGGLGPDEMVARCADNDVALLALNCSYGPASLDAPLRRLRALWEGPLGAWPNAGLPDAAGRPHPIGPEELARWVAARTAELDLRLVGGCCGAGPAHSSAIARALAPKP